MDRPIERHWNDTGLFIIKGRELGGFMYGPRLVIHASQSPFTDPDDKPLIVLEDPQGGRVEVAAEDLMRAALAAWELVRPVKPR